MGRVLQWLSWHKHTDKMKVSVLLLCLAVLLAVLLPETSGGRLSKRRNGRRSNGNKGRFQNLKRKLARRGRKANRRGRKGKKAARRGKQNKGRKGKKAGKANNKRQGRRRQTN